MNLHSVGVFTTDRDLVVQVWDSALARLTGIESYRRVGPSSSVVIPDLETRGLLETSVVFWREGVIEVLAPAFHRYLIPCPPQVRRPTRFDKMLQRVTIAPLRAGRQCRGLHRDDRRRHRVGWITSATARRSLTQDGVRNEKSWGTRRPKAGAFGGQPSNRSCDAQHLTLLRRCCFPSERITAIWDC